MLKVSVAKNLGGGFIPIIETFDLDSVWLADAEECETAEQACALAAQRLREAAARFELLSNEKSITREATHAKINRARIQLFPAVKQDAAQ